MTPHEPGPTPGPDADPVAPAPEPAGLRDQLFPSLLCVPLLTLLTGVLFPLTLALLARPLFPRQAGGSLLKRDGVVVGSELIGQPFREPRYFHPRPSAAGSGYDGLASGATNLGPNNPKLREGDSEVAFAGVRQLAEEYRRENGLAPDATVPIDAVTRSGSGLDPHISPANAALQAPRVARERGMGEEDVRALVTEHTRGRQLGFLGEPRVAVLALNLALDRAAPPSPARPGARRRR